MSEPEPRRSIGFRFSLRHLLTLTALIAIGAAVGLAYQKNISLKEQRGELLSLSSHLMVDDEGQLAYAEIPGVADDFHSWRVHVPSGQDYELRLGMGAISQRGIPPIVGRVQIPAGRHRVTLRTGDSPNEEFRYVVYVDGKQVIEKAMGSDWMPRGWSTASSMSWPRRSQPTPAPLQLSAKSYQPKHDFGTRHQFNGQSDSYVTRVGYRLWIDQPGRTYEPASPFMGFSNDPRYQGIGLRDGPRYKMSIAPPYLWTFTRPSLNTNDPVLRLGPQFFASDGRLLSSLTKSFRSWQLHSNDRGKDGLRWQEDLSQTAFLHATSKSNVDLQPVVELKWDADKPDEVGLRLADTQANEKIAQWKLRIIGGSEHLWRELQVADGPWIAPHDVINVGEVSDTHSAKSPDMTATLDLPDEARDNIHIQWQTNETLPLQIVKRSQKRYSGLGLYKGLPVTLGIQIPAALKPKLNVSVNDQHPNTPGTAFPGGPVFDEIQIELEEVEHNWIWLKVKSREPKPNPGINKMHMLR